MAADLEDLPSGDEPSAPKADDADRPRDPDPPRRPSSFPADDTSFGRSRSGDEREAERDKRSVFERTIPEILKRVVERAVESGAHRVAEAPENLKNFVSEMKLPKEVLHYLYTQVDETKNGLYRVAAKEIRDVLEQTRFADELTKVLTRLSFEIKTEIRFIPNDQAVSNKPGDETTAGLPKPEVKSQVSVKDRSKDKDPKRAKGREDT